MTIFRLISNLKKKLQVLCGCMKEVLTNLVMKCSPGQHHGDVVLPLRLILELIGLISV